MSDGTIRKIVSDRGFDFIAAGGAVHPSETTNLNLTQLLRARSVTS